MKKYKVLHHTLGNDEEGKRAWLNQTEKGHKHLEDHTAKDLNAQFVNSGIKYELVDDSVIVVDSENITERPLTNADKITIDWRDNEDGTSTAYIDDEIALLDGKPWIWTPKETK